MLAGVLGVLRPSQYGKRRYLDTLKMMFELCNKVRKQGLIGIENDIEKPAESELFKQFPAFLKDHHAEAFVCDTLRTAITGGIEPFDMDQMMELDMEVAHHESCSPSTPSYGGGRTSRPRHRRRRPRRRHHHGLARRPARRDRQKGRRRPRRHLPRHPHVLRPRRPARRQHDQGRRRSRTPTSTSSASSSSHSSKASRPCSPSRWAGAPSPSTPAPPSMRWKPHASGQPANLPPQMHPQPPKLHRHPRRRLP